MSANEQSKRMTDNRPPRTRPVPDGGAGVTEPVDDGQVSTGSETEIGWTGARCCVGFWGGLAFVPTNRQAALLFAIQQGGLVDETLELADRYAGWLDTQI